MSKLGLRISLFLPLFLLLILTGCSTGEKSSVVKLGVIAPLSGDAAVYGEQLQRVIDYYLPTINEKYKDQGISFEIIYEDGKCTGNDAVSAFQKLTDIDGVKFIIGGTCSSETLAIAPLSESKKVLVTSGFSSNPDIDGVSPYTYTLSYRDDVSATTLAKEMSKYKRVAMITEQNDYNVGIQNSWLEVAKNYPEMELVSNEVFPKGGTDFRNILEKIKNTNPEAILLNSNPGATAQALVKQLSEMKDWNNYQLFGQYAYTSAETIAAAPEKVEGMIIADAPDVSSDELLALIADIEAAKGTLGDMGVYYTGATADVLDLITGLIVELGDDPTVVRDALVSRDFSGYISDNYSFKNGSFPDIPGGVYVIKDGKPVYQK